ncbi:MULTISPECIES: ABC transporter permease [Microbacterium]|uniref:ABC transporter permease n=1 Tax=Microbacterium wangchenii TaxID=2541726 RepID=A0ABX5SZR0_9MICO|nr:MULTISPECIES: ABC transporter permease [Microbacterium]MCK6066004.1 ABC transporter permease [Microbacterium sp. EYE_512]QBR90294.1 ABC transporter permease [Microbacterium wangchenii]TFV84895.1 ABC transporter permease [Microbacterium sp. dk485]
MSRMTTSLVPTVRVRRGSSPLRRVGQALTPVWLPLLLIAVWWFVSAESVSPFFPPLSDILVDTWDQWVVFGAWTNAVVSLRNLFIGYLLGTLIGVVGGSLMWRLKYLRMAANPIIYFLYVLPAPALLPAMIAIFGIGDLRQIALIALGSIWPTLLNTLDGMRGIDTVKFDTARALRLGGWRTYTRLVLPGAAPQIAAGLRASLTVGIVLMVVSEMVAANSGIGVFILQAQAEFAIKKMWTGILVLAFIGTALNYLFVFVERRALRWYYRSRALGSS